MKVEAKLMETQCEAPPLAPFFVKYRNPGSRCVKSRFSCVHNPKVQKKKFINTKFIKTSGIRGRIRWRVSHQRRRDLLSLFSFCC